MRSSVSIVLFFLLSGFFLTALLGSLERSRRWLSVAAACLVALVCIIVFLKPVQLPTLQQMVHPSTTTTEAEPVRGALPVPAPTHAATAAGATGATTSTTAFDVSQMEARVAG